MTWNYRIIKNTINNVDYYAIHEVYYDDNLNPHSCSADPIYPYGDSLEELNIDFNLMKSAFSKPILDMSLFLKNK